MNPAMPASLPAPLDAGFKPAALFHKAYLAHAAKESNQMPFVIGLERENGQSICLESLVVPGRHPATLLHAERLVKFLLWSRGGWKLTLGGPRELAETIGRIYSSRGTRRFDAKLMASAYGRPFQVKITSADKVPRQKESGLEAVGHLRGCRIGFDLGASDYKVSAVKEGRVVFSEETRWDPCSHSNPDYHYHHLASALHRAAACLPRVNAIGGSSAGIIVDNEIRVASLMRSVPRRHFSRAASIFKRLQKEWGVPMQVMNDGDVTALAGSLSLGRRGILGLAMGSSLAAGFIDVQGHIRGWLNELAFVPLDLQRHAPKDEWSGDRGTGVSYLSQQAVGRLLGPAGIKLSDSMPLPERLKAVQDLMKDGDDRAALIYDTLGVYLGCALALYSEFYSFDQGLILGRVTSGPGGNHLLEKARKVLRLHFPEVATKIKLSLPDERFRRVGQSVAAASLPRLDAKS